jgi:hypothetical protein
VPVGPAGTRCANIKAVAEIERVLRPGGRPLLLDRIPSSSRLGRDAQRLLEQLPLRLEREHLPRRPLEHVLAEGFLLGQRKRLKRGIASGFRRASRDP